jgi:putative membrane protein
MTSIHFSTAMQGESANVVFKVISPRQADQMEKHIANCTKNGDAKKTENEAGQQFFGEEQNKPEKTVHFTPMKRDVIKASFTSLSFLVLVPLILSVYFQADKFLDLEKRTEGIFSAVLGSGWLIAAIVILLVISSITFGIVKVYLQYGKYEISSDVERIYIRQGVLEETSFSIFKGNVQAVAIEQSMLKRMLGIAEVKLISAGSLADDDVEISSLYPFLPKDRAYEMITEMLPSYRITKQLSKLPRQSLWMRMIRPVWFWVPAAIALIYFKPEVWGLQQAWWLAVIVLCLVVYTFVFFDYKNTRYTLSDKFIQIKKGSMATSEFISTRGKIIKVKTSINPLQRRLGLASIEIVNRANPVRHTDLHDISVTSANDVHKWYRKRTQEIKTE